MWSYEKCVKAEQLEKRDTGDLHNIIMEITRKKRAYGRRIIKRRDDNLVNDGEKVVQRRNDYVQKFLMATEDMLQR